MSLKQTRFYYEIKTTFEMVVGNKLRLILTMLGIGISIFIVETGLLFIEGYYQGCLYEAESMPRNTLIVNFSGQDAETNAESRKELQEKYYDKDIVTTRTEFIHTWLTTKTMANGGDFNIFSQVQAVTAMNGKAVYYSDEAGLCLVNTELIYGRYITGAEISDNAAVCVIDEYTSDLLFGKSNSVGEYIVLGSIQDDETPMAYQVVGVIKNNYWVEEQKKADEKIFNDPEYEDLGRGINVCIYCPYGILENLVDDTQNYGFKYVSIMLSSDEAGYKNLKGSILSQLNQLGYMSMQDYDDILAICEEELEPVRRILDIIIVILVAVSGITCISIVIFSMKERTYEIGIKKAFGGSSGEIFSEIMIENMLITFAASVVAIMLSLLISLGTEDYMANQLGVRISIPVTPALIFLPLCVGEILVFVFSCIPVLTATKISVVKALRTE
jgi:putative ABC transport system permease protein